MKLNLSQVNVAVEAAASKPIAKPRVPKFKGTEDTPWGDVDKTFKAFLDAYYDRTGVKKPEVEYTEFKECSDAIRVWMSNHSVLGNPNAESFSDGIVLPIVNPKTGKLNKGGVSSANAYAGKVKDVSGETIAATKKLLKELYEKYFKEEGSTESWDVSEEGIGSFIKTILVKIFGTDPNSPSGQKLLKNRLPAIKEKLDNASTDQLNSKIAIPTMPDMKKLEAGIGRYISELDKIKVGNRDSKPTEKDVEVIVGKLLKSTGLDKLIKQKGPLNNVTGYTDIDLKDLAVATTLKQAGYVNGRSIDELMVLIDKITEHGRKARHMVEEPSRWDVEYALEFENPKSEDEKKAWNVAEKALWAWVNATFPVSSFWEDRGNVKPFLPIITPLDKVLNIKPGQSLDNESLTITAEQFPLLNDVEEATVSEEMLKVIEYAHSCDVDTEPFELDFK